LLPDVTNFSHAGTTKLGEHDTRLSVRDTEQTVSAAVKCSQKRNKFNPDKQFIAFGRVRIDCRPFEPAGLAATIEAINTHETTSPEHRSTD